MYLSITNHQEILTLYEITGKTIEKLIVVNGGSQDSVLNHIIIQTLSNVKKQQ